MPSGTTKGTGLAPNIAGMVCYLCMPLTSIFFLVMEKENKEIQFHVWQSLSLFVSFFAAYIALYIVSAIIGSVIGFLGFVIGLFIPLLGLLGFALTLVCLVKAYQGERWKIPYLGDFAEKKAGLT